MPEYVIGNWNFPTKAAAKAEVRRVLNDSPAGEPLHGTALDLITALIQLHPTAEEKIGSGVKSIVTKRTRFDNMVFRIVRTDGSDIDFSYLKAIDGEPDKMQDSSNAMRNEITEDINVFRRAWFAENADADGQANCSITGAPLAVNKSAHVDHFAPTFDELAKQFVDVVGLDAVATAPRPDGIGRQLANRQVADSWRQFHNERAHLRVIHVSANLSRPRKDRS